MSKINKMVDIEAVYQNLWKGDDFGDVYKYNRQHLYEKLVSIIKVLDVTTVLDIGCAYGQLVNMLNDSAINAFGLDLPIEKLMDFHSLSKYSGKFLYGSIADDAVVLKASQIKPDLVCIIDTMRYLEPEVIIHFIEATRPLFIIVKEVSNSYLMRYKRRDQSDIGLISPTQLLMLFPKYEAYKIYVSRFLANFVNPGKALMYLINMFSPTYLLILKRREEI